MDIEIIKETETPLLNRKRVTLSYSSQDGKTLSRKEAVNQVSKKLGVKEDVVAIRHIYTQFGNQSSKIIAHIYKDAKTMEKYEEEGILVKQGLKEAKPKNAAKAAAAKK
jgi:small subunit ribosomal protein S24e